MNFKHIVRDAAYLCLGTASVIVEQGGKVAKKLIDKGSEAWHDNQDTIDAVKKTGQELVNKGKDLAQKAVDALTPEAAEKSSLDPDEIHRTDEPVPEAPEADDCGCGESECDGDCTCDDACACNCEAGQTPDAPAADPVEADEPDYPCTPYDPGFDPVVPTYGACHEPPVDTVDAADDTPPDTPDDPE